MEKWNLNKYFIHKAIDNDQSSGLQSQLSRLFYCWRPKSQVRVNYWADVHVAVKPAVFVMLIYWWLTIELFEHWDTSDNMQWCRSSLMHCQKWQMIGLDLVESYLLQLNTECFARGEFTSNCLQQPEVNTACLMLDLFCFIMQLMLNSNTVLLFFAL